MSFIWPIMLFSLILIPLAVVLYILLQRRRRRIAERYGSFGFVQEAAGRGLGARRHVPPALFLAGLTILAVAIARPQAVVSLPRIEGNVILAFDVSGSMAANDFKPTRIEAAKTAARDFIKTQPRTVQIGVVAFSDSGFSVQPPTNDQDAILAAINRLSPQRGTSLGQGIISSLKTIDAVNAQPVLDEHYSTLPTPSEPTPTPTPVPQGTYTPAVIVLLSDGENNENPDPLAAAQQAADRGVRIYTVGIGSAAGVNLHVNGFTVHTQLNEPMLQQIAQLTGGVYYNAQNEQDLLKIYNNLNPQLVIKPEKTEITSIFAGASILIMLVGGVFSFLWFSRLP
jgi:Ca-activated chloride channel family protein